MEKEKNSPAATRKASCDKDFILDADVVDVEEVPAVLWFALDRGEAAAADVNNGWTRISTPSNAAATWTFHLVGSPLANQGQRCYCLLLFSLLLLWLLWLLWWILCCCGGGRRFLMIVSVFIISRSSLSWKNAEGKVKVVVTGGI